MIFATCATILGILASAQEGQTIKLTGSCDSLIISRAYGAEIAVDAKDAKISGLTITGSNIRWRGGVVVASGGRAALGPAGYGIRISGSRITIEGVTVSGARKGIVIDSAQHVEIKSVHFLNLSEDGIIASRSSGLKFIKNTFTGTEAAPTACETQAGRLLGYSARACRSFGGIWTDGGHPDAIQMRNGLSNVLIAGNIISGRTQGITQMDTVGDLPLKLVTIRQNRVSTDAHHQITLSDCHDCLIEENVVQRMPGSKRRAVIRAGSAERCGNRVQDERVDDKACKVKSLSSEPGRKRG